MTLDLVPMLLLSLVLLTGGGTPVQTVEYVFDGRHEATAHRGALVVGDGEVIVPVGADVPGPIHLLGGQLTVEGAVQGDVTQFGGRLTVAGDATISGTLQHIGGAADVSPLAVVGHRSRFDPAPGTAGAAQGTLSRLLLMGVLAGAGAWWGRRQPAMLGNVADAAGGHPLVSLTVGALVCVTSLSLIVFMAFTLVLVPVSLLGLVVGVLVLGYAVIALGHLVGRRTPIVGHGAATAAGVTIVLVCLWVVGLIPVVGDLAVLGTLLAAVGAVVLTYFGLAHFTPATLPD